MSLETKQESTKVPRRDFHQLTLAAMGGILAGTTIGCGTGEPARSGANTEGAGSAETNEHHGDSSKASGVAPDWKEIITSGKNVCRGLNTCKGHKGGDNSCAGTGSCATAEAHTCHYANACKGEGGCGSSAGRNACKEKGECGVPLSEGTWKKARAAFEEAMKAAGKEFGEAPAKEEKPAES